VVLIHPARASYSNFDRGPDEGFLNFSETSLRASRRRMLNTRSGSGADAYPGAFSPLSDL